MNIASKSGGGLATLAYYNALCSIYPGLVDAALAEESCSGPYSSFIPIPSRSKLHSIFSGSLHRNKSFMKNFLKESADQYSICVINGSFYAGDMMDLIHSYGIKIVVIHHNYEVEYYMTNKSIFTFGGNFPYFVKNNERNAYKKADLNLFLTKPDMDKCAEVYGKTYAPCHILGVFEASHKEFKPSHCLDKDLIVITGSLCTYQTYHSIEVFEKMYYEKIKNHFPEIRILLAGRDPAEQVLTFEKKHPNDIKVVANPDNMDEITNMGSVYLCVTCVGGGLKLRVMDGLRRGMPVLVHKVSARGYEQFVGKPYFQVYDDPPSFIKGLTTILKYIKPNDKVFQSEIIDSYQKTFGFESGTKRLANFMTLLS